MRDRLIDITLFITDRMRAGVMAFAVVILLRLVCEAATGAEAASPEAPPAAAVVVRLPVQN